jgi:hypothetical protein
VVAANDSISFEIECMNVRDQPGSGTLVLRARFDARR